MNNEKPEIQNPHELGSILRCKAGHKYFVRYSCSPKSHSCEYCRDKRSRVIISKIYQKMEIAKMGITQIVDGKRKFFMYQKISMWTLGTDISYLREYDFNQEKYLDNLNVIMGYWQKFNTRLKVYTRRDEKFTWNPLFYVIESGSKGGKLHIHLLVHGFMPHSYIRSQWSQVTGIENPNVNFVDELRNIGYVAKYASKGALTYRFLGKLYKAKIPEYDKSCQVSENEGLTTCGMKFDLISNGSYQGDGEIPLPEYGPHPEYRPWKFKRVIVERPLFKDKLVYTGIEYMD